MALSFKGYATGALIGGVVGAVMGLRLAPRNRTETRQIIHQVVDTKRRGAADTLKEKSEAIKENVTIMARQLAETVAHFTEANNKTPQAIS